MNSNITAIVAHFYPERREYVRKIAKAILASSMGPRELIIWDNSDSHDLDAPYMTTLIESQRNSLMGRYAAILLAETPFVFVQDDDLLISTDTIASLYKVAAEKPYRIVGTSGCVIPWYGAEKPYSTATWVKDGPVDVVLGRCFMAHRSCFAPGFKLILEENIQPGRADDLLFSLAAGGGIVVPAEITNLDERKTGLSWEKDHLKQRDEFASMMLRRLASSSPTRVDAPNHTVCNTAGDQ